MPSYSHCMFERIGIACGLANRALNDLYSSGAIKRRQEGKMHFYSVDLSNAAVTEFKKLINIMLIEPLTEELKNISSRIVLYGSCAHRTDTSHSDLDLFIVSSDRERVMETIGDFSFPRGFEDIHIQSVIKTPVELLEKDLSKRQWQ